MAEGLVHLCSGELITWTDLDSNIAIMRPTRACSEVELILSEDATSSVVDTGHLFHPMLLFPDFPSPPTLRACVGRSSNHVGLPAFRLQCASCAPVQSLRTLYDVLHEHQREYKYTQPCCRATSQCVSLA